MQNRSLYVLIILTQNRRACFFCTLFCVFTIYQCSVFSSVRLVEFVQLNDNSLCQRFQYLTHFVSAGFLFINRTEVLPQDLVKFRGWEIRFDILLIGLKFDRYACLWMFRSIQSRGFDISRDLAVTRVNAYRMCNVCIVYEYVFDGANVNRIAPSDRVIMKICKRCMPTFFEMSL